MKNKALILLALCAVVVLSGCSGGVRPTSWTHLIVDEGTVYAADVEQVRVLEAETGEVRWAFPPEADLRTYGPFYSVVLAGDTLLATANERSGSGLFARPPRGVLRALDIESRQIQWEFAETEGEFVAAGAVTDGLIVIGSGDGNVYALSVADGARAWTFPTGERVWAAPLILSDTVYIASLDHTLYALDLQTGAERWRFEAGGALVSAPAAQDDTLYIGAFDNAIYALDAQTGQERWRFSGQNWFWGTPVISGTVLYAADVSGNVYAVDTTTQQAIWQVNVGEPVRLGPALSADGGELLIAGADARAGTLYGLDISDGFIIWEQPAEGQLGSLVVSGPMVYVSRILGRASIQAYYADNGRPVWSYPPPEAGQ